MRSTYGKNNVHVYCTYTLSEKM